MCSERSVKASLGATMVEAAISMQLFLLVVLFGSFLSVAMYKYVSLQYVVSEAARRGLLPDASTGYSSRALAIEGLLVEEGARYGLDFGEPYVFDTDHSGISVCTPSGSWCGSDDAGEGRELFQITARQPLSFLGMNLSLEATVMAKNEPIRE